MQYILNFYLQIFRGVQYGFLLSCGWRAICMRFRGTIAWPPRSPVLTPLEFSVWGYVKDKVFVPHFRVNLEELRARIRETVTTVDADRFIGLGTRSLTDGTLPRDTSKPRGTPVHIHKLSTFSDITPWFFITYLGAPVLYTPYTSYMFRLLMFPTSGSCITKDTYIEVLQKY
jgi:hypothetical protein